MPDGGPVYCETDPGRFPVEPWATVSELAFLWVVVVWAVRLRGRYREHAFVSFTLPVILFGFVGGVLFHAFRSSRVFFLMDVIPIGVLVAATLAYLGWRVTRRRWVAVLYPVFVLALNRLLFRTVDDRITAIAFSYALSAAAIAGPLLWEVRRRGGAGARPLLVAAAAVAAGTALHHHDGTFCDAFPPGTLWIWHLCAGVAIHCTLGYLVSYPVDEPVNETGQCAS